MEPTFQQAPSTSKRYSTHQAPRRLRKLNIQVHYILAVMPDKHFCSSLLYPQQAGNATVWQKKNNFSGSEKSGLLFMEVK
jgi:hypothetical protein